ncbi:MAG: nodulation protein NfeD [Acidobacteriota bacterium]
MNRAWCIALGLVLASVVAGPVAEAGPEDTDASTPTVRVYRLEGAIHGASAQVLLRVLDEARRNGDSLVVIELDTPGGLVTSAQEMISALLNSEVPVAVYVSPKGAHAASAGFFLLLAADVAAMAPVTRTGSAHPVAPGGANDKDDVALRKVAEDLAALIRAAAEARGRPAKLAEQAVFEARSWSAEEALEAGLIDLIAQSTEELVERLDGREIIRANGERRTLKLAGARIVRHELTGSEQLKNMLFHPVVMGMLLLLAGIGFYIEYHNPGMFIPGLIGLVALVLFLYGTRALPVNLFGVALIALGIVMFVLEVKITSYGLLTIGGVACVSVGLYLLFDRSVPGLAVPAWAIVVLVGSMMAVVLPVMALVIKAQRRRPTTGREGVVGEVGESTTPLDPEGTVLVHGELWRARSVQPVPSGTRIRVRAALPGLMLEVEPLDATASAAGRDAKEV